MKRSEMVDIIQKALTPVLENKQSFFVKSVSFHLLKIIEDAGMLPPIEKNTYIIPEVYDTEIDEDLLDWIGNHDEYTPVFALQWVPENAYKKEYNYERKD